ncbi:STAS domain-containing protein [Roseobacter denitrificans]|uniref:STAS domain-containing protein n=1 Tax=Roseobacter denitrificans TaxID=2434 RepID=UPI000322E5C6|nr:STAS domain-containing protein [Roseobacter denitrificans]AVL52016.1 STAS domain-containing protein [Roseobacter denitrificans]SFF83752.1 chemotaxis protein CheX [Roseobacter denitrificans OCh 114]
MSEPIVLGPKLDLAAASGLTATLRDCKDKEVVLDLTEVKHFGALCMQAMISAAVTAQSEDRKITITNASDRVLDQMRVMGMTPESITRGRP